MKLENKFTIAVPIEEAWAALNNPETTAPCFPGATLQSYEADSFTGTVKVKLGPISLTYKGKGTYVDRDDAAHKVVIDAFGRDSRGNGTASAKVTGTMMADGPDRTHVTMVTNLTVTGRPAQFGRGVMSDISEKIIGQFASCLTDRLGGGKVGTAGSAAAGPAAAGPAAVPSPASTNGSLATATTTATPVPAPAPTTRAAPVPAPAPTPTGAVGATGPIPATPPAVTATTAPKPAATRPSSPMRSEVDAIDLLDTAGGPVLKRLAPVLSGVVVLLIILSVRRRRSR